MSSRIQTNLLTSDEVVDLWSRARLPLFIKVVEILGQPNVDGARVFLAFIMAGSQKTFVLLRLAGDAKRKSEGFNWPKEVADDRLRDFASSLQIEPNFILRMTKDFAPIAWKLRWS